MISALGCAANTNTDEGGETTATTDATSEALSVYQWAPDSVANSSHSWTDASIATATFSGNEYTFMVHTGDNAYDHSIYWAYSTNGIAWNSDNQIPAMYSNSQPQLAAFNGHLYMLHTGDNDRAVWMSRFNPTTWSWDHDFLLPYQSWASPSIASYNGSLYIIGTTYPTGQVWQATMSTAEVFTPQADLPGITTSAASPSLAAHCPPGPSGICFSPVLYMAYVHSGQLTMSGLPTSFRGGAASWWTPWVVANVDGSLKGASKQPAIASYGGMLHIVRKGSTDDRIMWTYYDGSNWSTDVSIGAEHMWGSASLAPRSNRLVMVHSSSDKDHSIDGGNSVYGQYFQ